MCLPVTVSVASMKPAKAATPTFTNASIPSANALNALSLAMVLRGPGDVPPRFVELELPAGVPRFVPVPDGYAEVPT